MFPAGVDHIREMNSEHGFGCISMMLLQGVIWSLRDIGLAYDIHNRITPCQMRWGVKYNHLTISFLYKPGYYIISRTMIVYIVC